MRTSLITILGAAALAALAGCTVKDVDQPALAGPSTFGHQIIMTTERNVLTQNGTDFVDIRITSLGPDGRSETLPLKAQIYVDGAPQDFGTLSTKDPVTPTTIRYTAPAASLIPSNAPTTISIVVVPTNSGDARAETGRQIDLRLQPQGVLNPSNPTLKADFSFSPATPKVLDVVQFDAATSTNAGTACGINCFYAWNFGDGSTGSGQVVTHQFRAVNTYSVTLTVTDSRSATATTTKTVSVSPGLPPTASFTVSPTPPPTNVDIFFNATASRPATGRTITSYSWEFGDGTGGSGPIVTHKFTGAGTFVVVLTVTDDAGTQTQLTQNLNVGTVASEPSAVITATTVTGRTLTVDASGSKPGTGASIVNYKIDYGDGNFENVSNPVQSHTYSGPGTFLVLLEVTDSNGKKAATTKSVTIP